MGFLNFVPKNSHRQMPVARCLGAIFGFVLPCGAFGANVGKVWITADEGDEAGGEHEQNDCAVEAAENVAVRGEVRDGCYGQTQCALGVAADEEQGIELFVEFFAELERAEFYSRVHQGEPAHLLGLEIVAA